MIFFYDVNGNVIQTYRDHVYQGSGGANDIFLVAPFPRAATVTVAFVLPNGYRTKQYSLTMFEGELPNVETNDGQEFSCWNAKIADTITAYSGTVRAQFFITTVSDNVSGATQTLTTEYAAITVEKGVAPVVEPEEGDSYQDLIDALTEFKTYYQDQLDDLKSVVYILSDQDIHLKNLTAGVYKLTYAPTTDNPSNPLYPKKLFYANGSSGYFPIYSTMPVMLYITQRNDGTDDDIRDYYLFEGGTNNSEYSFTLHYGYASESGGIHKTADMTQVLTDISKYVQNNLTYDISNNTYALSAYQGFVLKGLIDTINSKIPTNASSENQLADKAWATGLFEDKKSVTYKITVSSNGGTGGFQAAQMGYLVVNWGDGSSPELINCNDQAMTGHGHNYAVAGNYYIKIVGITDFTTNIILSGAKEVYFGDGVLSISGNFFYPYQNTGYYSNLSKVVIPDSVTTIGGNAFYGCTALESVAIGNGVTTIGDDAFHNCSSLEKILIGTGITDMSGLSIPQATDVTILATTPPTIDIHTFVYVSNATTGKIYVPYDSLNAYKTAFGGVSAVLEGRIEPIQDVYQWVRDNFVSDTDFNTLNTKVATIEGLIPASASSSNKLTDKEYVDTAIATNSAHFLGTFASVNDLLDYSGTKTNNDYANVINSVHNYITAEAMFNANKADLTDWDYGKFDDSYGGYNGWHYYRFDKANNQWVWITNLALDTYDGYVTYYNRYTYNSNSGWEWNFSWSSPIFTTAQLAALNSGITAAKVVEIDEKVDITTTIAGIALTANISAQALTDALVFCNTTTDVDDIMGD